MKQRICNLFWPALMLASPLAEAATDAVQFDGDDYLVMANISGELESVTAMSMVFWVKFDDVSQSQCVFSTDNEGFEVCIDFAAIDKSAGALFASEDGGNLRASNGNVWSAGVWYQLAVTYDGGANAYRFFRDGQLLTDEGETANPSLLVVSSETAHVGQPSLFTQGYGYVGLKGTLDDLQIYNATLSQPQIDNLYSGGSPQEVDSTEANLIAYWKFNDASAPVTDSDDAADNGGTSPGGANEPLFLQAGVVAAAVVDNTPPVVSAITLSGSPAATAASVDFVVSFDESANNVSTDDFSLTTTGTAAGSIGSVSAASGSSITVTVNSISGTGTLRLDLESGSNISDDSGNTGVAAFTFGASHSVDRDAPAFENSTPSVSAIDEDGATLTVDLTEEGKAYYVVVADGSGIPSAAEVKAGQGSGGGTPVTSGSQATSSTEATLAIGSLSASTAYDLYVVAEDGQASPNLQTSATRVDFSTTAPPDLTPPAVSLSGASGTINAPFTLTISFSEVVSGFVVGDITVGNGSASGFSGSGDSYSATITPTADGVVTVDVAGGVAEDGASNGNTAASQLSVTYDGTPPDAPSGLDLAAASDSGSSDSDDLTRLTTVTVGGSGESGAALTLFADLNDNQALDGGEPSATGSVTAGSWSLALGGLSEGSWNLRAVQTDAAGNGSAVSALLALTVDTSAPTGHSVTLDDDPVNQGNGQSSGFRFASAEAGAEYSYSISSSGGGSALTGSGTLAGDSDAVAPLDLSVMADGTLTLSVVVTDSAGNAAPAVTDTAGKDATAPSGYGVSIDPAVVNAANVDAFSFTLSGAEVGSNYSYQISDGGAMPLSGQGTVSSASQTISGIDVAALAEGTLTLSVTLTDPSGNGGGAVTDTVTKDAVGPQVTSVSLNSGQLSVGDSIQVTVALDDSVQLSGGNSVARLLVGDTSRDAVLSGGNNSPTLSFSYQVQAGDNDDDGVTLTAIDTQGDSAADANGNPAQLSFTALTEPGLTVDTLAPEAASAQQGAQTLDADTLTLSQGDYGENGVQILLLADANGDGVADSASSLASDTVVAGSWSLEAPLTQDADNHFVLRAQDDAGNYSDAAIGSFLEDSQAPAAPVVVAPSADTFQSDTALTVSGSHGEDGVRILLLSDADNDGQADSETAQASTAVSGGSWQIALTLAQNSTTHLVAVAEDDAGNRSAAVDLPWLVHDDIAPSADMAQLLTASATPALVGTLAEAGGIDTLAISLIHSDGSRYGPYAPDSLSDSNWQDDATADSLADGSYTLELTPVDKAGNSQVITLAGRVVVDTQAPAGYAVAIEQSRIDAFNQQGLSFLLSGGSTGEEYAYRIDGPQGGRVTGSGTLADGQQRFSGIDVTALAQGQLTLSLVLTDAAGNQGPEASDQVLKQYNLAPELSGTPPPTAEEDLLYSFTPTLTDPDGGDSHSFLVSGLPAWAQFDSASGRLWGTPLDEHVGSHGNITITVTDAAGASDSLGPFSINVVNRNDPPQLAGIALTTAEDTQVALALPAEDQEGDRLSYRLQTAPGHGSVSQQGPQWRYTPDADFHGRDTLQLIASDAELESGPVTVTIEVTPVNDKPVARDDQLQLASNPQGRYQLAVLDNDSDVDGDPLTIVGAQASLGQLTLEPELLTLALDPGFSGDITLSYLIADDAGETAEASVSLAIGEGDAEGQPQLTPPEPVEVNASALFTRVDLGVARAVDAAGKPLPVSLEQGEPLFRPGAHQVYWQTQDEAGNSVSASQLVKVHPQVNLHKDQTAAEGTQVVVALTLNGDAVTYPLALPFALAGTAEPELDYRVDSDRFVVTSGRHAQVVVTLLQDGQAETDETIELVLDDSLNLGHKGRHTITVSDGNLAPSLQLDASQDQQWRTLLAQDGGLVVVTAAVADPNPGDSPTLSWRVGDDNLVDLDGDAASFSFDPQTLVPGDYRLEVTASDGELHSTEGITLQLVASLAPLGEEDSDGDLIPDSREGYGDADNDGVPDYLDALDQCHLQPEELQLQQQYLFEGEEGVCLRAGALASGGSRRSVWVDELDPLPGDDGFLALGGTFDFVAEGLPQPGQSYRLVLPQRSPVPAGAIYRKYSPQRGWYQFVEQGGDAIHSAAGEPGYCPPPGGPQWQSGLREGAWCVQLTISDGGPNDADGQVDGSIHDPGAVAVADSGNRQPVVVSERVTLMQDRRGQFDPMASAEDPDGDPLELVWALAELGQVGVGADGSLLYQPPAGYLGLDRIRYLISDGQGGATQGSIEVTLVANAAPLARADYLVSDDLTEVVVDVLANDSDADGDTLTLAWVQAQVGQASITADNRILYRPQPGYEGEDRVTYQIEDPLGASARSQLVLTLDAHEQLVVSDRSGGALGWGGLLAALLLLLRRGLWLTLLLPVTAQAQWRLQLQGGYSHGDADSAAIRRSLEAAGVTLSSLSVDDTAVSWGVGIGYELTPAWLFRFDYQDLGRYSLDYAGTALDPEAAQRAAAGSGPQSAEGVALGLHYSWWPSPSWGLSLGGGAWVWQGESVSSSELGRFSVDSDGSDWFGELGISYRFDQRWQFSGGWQQFKLDSSDIGNGFARLEYRF